MGRLFERPLVIGLLSALILLDVAYVLVIGFAPNAWFEAIHGVSVTDPEGYLRRTAAVWASFALFQTIALVRWRKHPHWLMFVAGIRSTEAFADWVFIAYVHNLTAAGEFGLLVATPINTLCTIYFFRAYLHWTSGSSGGT